MLSLTTCRLRAGKVLVLGMNATSAEIVKNIVLAGIGSVALLDRERVQESDLCANFLLTAEDLGKNVRRR